MVPKRPIALYGKIGSVYRRPCFSFVVFVPEENDLQKDCPKLCVLSLLSGREPLLNITKIQSRVGSMGHESYSLETCQKSLQLNLCLEVLPAGIMFKSWHQQSPSMPLSSFMVTWPHASKHLAHQRFFFLPSGFGVFKAAKEKLQHPYLQSISQNMSIHQSGHSEIILQLLGNLSHHLHGFMHPRWLLRISVWTIVGRSMFAEEISRTSSSHGVLKGKGPSTYQSRNVWLLLPPWSNCTQHSFCWDLPNCSEWSRWSNCQLNGDSMEMFVGSGLNGKNYTGPIQFQKKQTAYTIGILDPSQ